MKSKRYLSWLCYTVGFRYADSKLLRAGKMAYNVSRRSLRASRKAERLGANRQDIRGRRRMFLGNNSRWIEAFEVYYYSYET